ncbi:MAG: radical SAM protein, partial [Clostridia bacterium]|nr:radical SAM protein [Clostridia bacterium]
MALKVGMVSLGCSKNRVDSEVLLGILRDNGYEIVADPAEADVVFVNTCGFIEPAKEESIDAIFEMAEYKKTGKLKKLFVTGCLSQRYADALYDEMPEVDGFMGVSDYARTIEMLKKAEEGEKPVFTSDGERFLDTERVLTTPPYTAYIKISDGCDNKCTYCAIPLIRGSYRSRPYDDIITECRQLAAKGVRELVFIAQDTSRYG